MKRILLTGLLLLGFTSLHGQSSGETVDFTKARQFSERRQRGETLTDDERTYLERAAAERRKQQGNPTAAAGATAADIDWEKARALYQRNQRGDKLTPEEDLYLKRAVAARNAGGGGGSRPANQRQAPERLTPLTDMAAGDRYEGEDGGLYGGGRNTPPDAHRQAAEVELAKIRPLNAEGEPDENGVIGFVAISMSNATQEFSRFKQVADRSPLKSPKVVIVDCAQGGQAMAEWAPADARPWEEARRRLAAAKVSPRQVQTAWIKLANKGPTGSLPDHGRKLERDTLAVLHHAKTQFPNLRIAYLGSRTYGGNATGGLNPEPYAYESAFAARWLIQRQMQGDAELALAKSPLLLWGPYLWAEGAKGRKIDQLVWERADFGADGVHPSDSGRQKVAELLLNFLTTDSVAQLWFVKK
jgi:hypothetical protein